MPGPELSNTSILIVVLAEKGSVPFIARIPGDAPGEMIPFLLKVVLWMKVPVPLMIAFAL